MNARQVIAQCVRRCARARDGRGPWQARQSCVAALIRLGQPALLAYDTARAAERVGTEIGKATREALSKVEQTS